MAKKKEKDHHHHIVTHDGEAHDEKKTPKVTEKQKKRKAFLDKLRG
jgi:hypothetical protein